MTVGKLAVRGILWMGAATYANMLVTIATSIALARLLDPRDFGVIAYAAFLLSVVGLVKEWGFDSALLHRQDRLGEAIPTHFALHVIGSLLVLGLAVLLMPLAGRYKGWETAWVVVLLGLGLVFESGGATVRTLLEKEMAFRATGTVEFVSSLLANIAGVAYAALGGGLWSLVVLRVALALFRTAGFWIVSSTRFGPRLSPSMAWWYLRSFGLPIWLGGFFSIFTYQFDDFLVGSLVGLTELGFYSKAFAMSLLPLSLTGVLSRVVSPIYSSTQRDLGHLARTFELAQGGKIRLVAPFVAIMWFGAFEFVILVLGEKWLPMVPLLRVLLAYGLLRSVFDDTAALTTLGLGRPDYFFRIQVFQGISLVSLGPLLVWVWGAKGAAWVMTGMMLCSVVLVWRLIAHRVPINVREIVLNPMVSLTVASATVGVGMSVAAFDQPALSFLYKGFLFAVAYAAVLLALERQRLARLLGTAWTLCR
ncbi:MAG TPA: oligosaccharide flippase family protein [Methylomirabilota bacterium]|nr:oligosaccharide flippase family protein [Methylomirabilota bacterium]